MLCFIALPCSTHISLVLVNRFRVKYMYFTGSYESYGCFLCNTQVRVVTRSLRVAYVQRCCSSLTLEDEAFVVRTLTETLL